MTFRKDEEITQTGKKAIRLSTNLDHLNELVGKVMAEQVRQKAEQARQDKKMNALIRAAEKAVKNSRRPPPVISAGTLSIIVTATTVIVSTIITVLRETGVLK